MSLFLTINVGCLFSWGSMMWGVLHSSLMLYEANDVHEANVRDKAVSAEVQATSWWWRTCVQVRIEYTDSERKRERER